jgi:hypothetical protein
VDAGCSAAGVAGVTRYEDLDCWKLANELKLRVYEMIDASSAKQDFRFRDQLRAAVSSGPSNLAEAFGRDRHKNPPISHESRRPR